VTPTPDPSASWSSVLVGLGGVADPRWLADGTAAWVRHADGRTDLVAGRSPDGPLDLTAGGPGPAGTRGGCLAPAGDGVVVADAEGNLRVLGPDGALRAVVAARGRAAAPAVHDGLVAFVDETDDACVIALAPLDGSEPARVVSRGADWSWDPAWSPDGRSLAWHEWDAPAMPWDGSRIVVAGADGGDPLVVAGGPDESVGQPRFAPTGPDRLAFVSDRDGWTTLHVVTAGHHGARIASPGGHEHAQPAWGPGQRSYAWSPGGTRLAWCRNEDGFGRLVIAEVAALATGEVRERSKGWHHGLDWGAAGILCVRSGARTVPTVTVLDPDTDRRLEVARAPGAAFADDLEGVEPTPVGWHAPDGTLVNGLRYGPADATRPLLVDVHGGPTDQAIVEWGPRVQAFVARGWTVLRPNARGSTGRGRAFTQALHGEWGGADVDDVVAGIRTAVVQGWCDPGRVAVMGGSAGGFTALLVAAAVPDLVRAVVALYPVTDLRALAADTHRFEAHSCTTLVGPLPDAADRYARRSPVRHADRLRVPLLVLQGANDPVVPAAQSAAFVDAVRRAGGDVEVHVYPGEGHGWRSAATVGDAFARTTEFLDRKVLT